MTLFSKPISYLPIVIPDSYEDLDLTSFDFPEKKNDYIQSIMISHKDIKNQAKIVSSQVFAGMNDYKTVFICLMNGGARFFEIFLKLINSYNEISNWKKPIQIFYWKIETYMGDKKMDVSDENFMKNVPKLPNMDDKDIIFFDDIVDSGHSMVKAINWAITLNPKSVKSVVMTKKRTERSNGYYPDYCLFEIPDFWIIGMGLDYNQHFRHLDHICVISDKGKEEFAYTSTFNLQF